MRNQFFEEVATIFLKNYIERERERDA